MEELFKKHKGRITQFVVALVIIGFAPTAVADEVNAGDTANLMLA